MRVAMSGLADLVASQPGLPFWAGEAGMGGLADLVGSGPGLPFWPAGNGMGDLSDLVASQPGLPFWASGSGMAGGCGCGGSCGGCGGHGMGQLTTDLSSMMTNMTSGNFSGAWTNFTNALQEPVIGTFPVWGVGAVLIAAWYFMGAKKRRR